MTITTKTSTQNNKINVSFLNLLITDEYVLYTKTRTAQWNIEGENYFDLYMSLEKQHNSIDNMIIDIADLIRSCGHIALGSCKNIVSITQKNNVNRNFSKSVKIFKTLQNDHEIIISNIQRELLLLPDQFNENKTATLLTELMEKHKKMAWTLRFLFTNPNFNLNESLRNNKINAID